MAQNVEIKARAVDFLKQSEIAKSLSGGEPEIIQQEDVFFNVSAGRLKLRVFSPDRCELIFYQRPDQQGPSICQYEISRSDDSDGMKSLLKKALGIRSTVVKTRYLYMSGRTRIHFDRVDSLGEFIELEVVLSDSDPLVDGENEAQILMDQLGIETSHLVEAAYVDLLELQSG
ncbi:MAG: class IV adenylate cyclase [Verrucomicrobia bacterium]|nr:class IV adenylate cyclase [Verrucomicrobiota bacterium]